MNTKDKKMVVLHQLSQESEPIGLSELLDKLGTNTRQEASEDGYQKWSSKDL